MRQRLIATLLVLLSSAPFSFAQKNIFNKNTDYLNKIGDYYVYFGINHLISPNKILYADENHFINAYKPLGVNEYTLGIGYKLTSKYYLNVQYTSEQFNSGETDITIYDKNSNAPIESGISQPIRSKISIGLETYYPLYKNLFLKANANIWTLFAFEDGYINPLRVTYFHTYSNHKVIGGVNLKLGLDYIIYKRFAVFGDATLNYSVTDKHPTYTDIVYEDKALNTKTVYLSLGHKRVFYNLNAGIKIGLEHKNFYNKQK